MMNYQRRSPATTGILVLALAAISSGAAFAVDVSDGPQILDRIDEIRRFSGNDFASVLTLISEDPDEGVEKQVVQQFRRDDDEMFLMLVQEPMTMLGQGYLRVEDNLWFYDPESRNFNRTSMKEQFSGSDARNPDFGASSYAEDYEVTAIAEAQLGRYDVYILDLEARHNEVTYPAERVWVTRDLYLPLKVEDYSETGRLMRTTLIPNYARVDDTYIATSIILSDELIPGKRTRITLSDISVEPLPDSIFTKSYVERVNR
ncbi:MAG: outer membrane lipoprotein-sorting protein [Spirochaetota bacterium]